MEQDHLPCSPDAPLLPPCDREVFERVWRRVMPEDRPDCPFLLEQEPERGPESAPPAEVVPAPQADVPVSEPGTALAVSAPAAATPAAAEVRAPNDSLENDVPCLGAASAVHSGQLQAFIDREISDWHTYQMLARRAQGAGGKALATLAADERRHAKRLSTAYFLISGVRYWPVERMAAHTSGTYPAILRARFCAEQKGECAYLAAAEETADPALRELFLELAGDENAHAWLLRGILEQL